MNDSAEHEARQPGGNRLAGALILLAGAGAAAALWLTAPTPKRRPTEPHKPLVTVTPLERVDHQVRVEARGRVQPLTRVELVPQVSGRVVRVHPSFVPGGRIPAGAALVTIDPRDYQVAVQTAEAELAAAEEELKLERGRQRAAQAEWTKFGHDTSTEEQQDLATRGPQVRAREAAVARARAALEQARLDLERCRLALPYPVVLSSIDVAVGSVARAGTPLGVAFPVKALWVNVSLPVEQLKWFSPRVGHEARVWPQGEEAPITGQIKEILPGVEARGSLGQLLVEIPLSDAQQARLPMHVGELVRLELLGHPLDGVFVLPRSAVHGEAEVWLLDDRDQLVIQPVTPVFRGLTEVVVRDGLEDGARLVLTQLAQPVNGMPVRVAPAEAGAGGGAR